MAVKVATGVSDWISCRDRIDVASTKAFFEEKGYINEKGFLSESEVQTIRDELQRYREEVGIIADIAMHGDCKTPNLRLFLPSHLK